MLLGITIAYMIGIIGGLYKIIIVPFFVFYLIVLVKNKNLYYKLIIIVISFVLGFINITALENSFNNKYKDVENLNVIATIISNKEEKGNLIKYKIKVEDKKYLNTNLILSIKKQKNINLEYADKIYIEGIYEKPKEATNFGAFSYKDYLKTKKIYGIIKANYMDIKLIKKNNTNFTEKIANDLSTNIVEKVESFFDNNQAGLLIGILLGNKDYLDKNIIENFKDSNLSHMLAISGAHVSYIILGITYFFNLTKFSKKISKIVTIILLLFFILLVGGTPSVTRACIMSIYLIVGTIIYKKPDIKSSICLSMMIILLKNPYNIFDIGFELSYGGTIGIILFANKFSKDKRCNKESKKSNKNSKIKRVLNYIKQMAIVSICANIIIIPIMAYHFNTVSLTFIISNILAGPILGVVVIIGFIYTICLFIFPQITIILGSILKIFLQILIQIAEICSRIPFSKIYVKTPNMLYIIIYYIFIFLIYKYSFKKIIYKIKSFGYKKITSVILIVIILFQFIKIIPQNLKIYFIDVGQGDSTLIVTPYRKTILIDGGGSSTSDSFDVGKQTLIPYLLDRGITKIDYLIVSHFDIDHVGRSINCYGKTKNWDGDY